MRSHTWVGLGGLVLVLGSLPCGVHAAPHARQAARPTPRHAPAHRARRHPPQRLVLRGTSSSSAVSGDYSGVTPGLPRMPRIWLPRAARNHCYISWTGFQLLPRGSRLFLQFNRRPSYELVRKPGQLLIELKGCRPAHSNTLRPLDTRWFDTPVLRARLHHRRRGSSREVVRLKRAATPHLRVVRLQGWYYLFITFHHVHRRHAPPRRAHGRPAARPAPRRPGRGPTPP